MKKRIKRKLKRIMEDNALGVMICLLIGLIIMFILSGERNTRKSHYAETCDHDWEYDGENGSKVGAFYRCKKCGKSKYIPYKNLMGMPEDEFNYWSNRPPTNEEKYRQNCYQHKFEYEK